jgi:hypothetical protein
MEWLEVLPQLEQDEPLKEVEHATLILGRGLGGCRLKLGLVIHRHCLSLKLELNPGLM